MAIIFFTMLWLLAYTSPVIGDTLSIEYLAAWNGRYPSVDSQGMPLPRGRKFMDDANVRALIKGVVPAPISQQIISEFGGNSRESLIQLIGGILIVNIPMQHSTTAAALFFDIKRGLLQICWQADASYWYGKRREDAPPDFCRNGTIADYHKMTQY
jgi:hypothetical protein